MVLQKSIVAYVLSFCSVHNNLEERRVSALGVKVNGGRVPELDCVTVGVRMVDLLGPLGWGLARGCCWRQ